MAKITRHLKKLKNLKSLGTLAVVGSICSILAFFIGMFDQKHLWVLAIGYTVFAFSLSAITFYEMHYRKKIEVGWLQAKRLIDTYQGKSYEFHLVFHNLREANTLLIVSEEFNKDKHTQFKTCMEKCLSQVSKFFTELTGIECAACIKLLLDSADPIKVATLVRDEGSEWRYTHDNNIYELQKNTAFSSIWNSDNRWFYSCDLVVEADNGHYLNQNPDWLKRHHYKTTAVLPIQSPRKSDQGEEYQGIKGFLCLDSPEENAFPEQPTVNWLACLADMLYITLMHYRKFDKVVQAGEQNEQEEN